MNCQICKYSTVIDEGARKYKVCRRYPPNTLLRPVQNPITGEQALAIQPVFPPVQDTDYCGEFKTNENDANEELRKIDRPLVFK